MGRNRIKIERIENDRTRMSTFNKRKNGLLKKAMELSILCDCEVALIVISPNSKKVTHYAKEDMETILDHYRNGTFEEAPEVLHNSDYEKLFKNKPASKRARYSPDPSRSPSISPVSFGRTSPSAVQMNGTARSIPMPGGGMMTVSKFPVSPVNGMRYVAPRSISPNPAAGTVGQSVYASMNSPVPGHVSPPNFFAVPPAAAIRPGAVRPSTPTQQMYGMSNLPVVATPSALMTPNPANTALPDAMDLNAPAPASTSPHHFAPRPTQFAPIQPSTYIQQTPQPQQTVNMFKKTQNSVLEYSQSVNKKNLSLDIPDARTTVTDAAPGNSFEDITKLTTPSLTSLGMPSGVSNTFLAMETSTTEITPSSSAAATLSSTSSVSNSEQQGVLPSPSSFFNNAGPLGPLGPDPQTQQSQQQQPQQTPGSDFVPLATPTISSGAWTPTLSSNWFNAPKTPTFPTSTNGVTTPTFAPSTGLSGSPPSQNFYTSGTFSTSPTQEVSENGTKRKLSEMKA